MLLSITCQNIVSIAECTSTMQKIHRYQLYQTYVNINSTDGQYMEQLQNAELLF